MAKRGPVSNLTAYICIYIYIYIYGRDAWRAFPWVFLPQTRGSFLLNSPYMWVPPHQVQTKQWLTQKTIIKAKGLHLSEQDLARYLCLVIAISRSPNSDRSYDVHSPWRNIFRNCQSCILNLCDTTTSRSCAFEYAATQQLCWDCLISISRSLSLSFSFSFSLLYMYVCMYIYMTSVVGVIAGPTSGLLYGRRTSYDWRR